MEQAFFEFLQKGIAARSTLAERSVPMLALASQRMTDCLLQNGKIFTWGNQESAFIAQMMAYQLLSGYQMERPALPAWCLNQPSPQRSSSVSTDYPIQLLRTLANPGDVLLILHPFRETMEITPLIQAAHEMSVALIFCHAGAALQGLIDDDVELIVPSTNKTILLDSIFSLCMTLNASLDYQLFGSEL